MIEKVSRVPLWRDSPENIIGVVHARDILRALEAAHGDASKIDLEAIAQAAVVRSRSAAAIGAARGVPAAQKSVCPRRGRVRRGDGPGDPGGHSRGNRRRHIATSTKSFCPACDPQPDGSVNVDGAVPIRDLNRAMDWHLPDADATTIAGFVIHEARSIPEPGPEFHVSRLPFQYTSQKSKPDNRVADHAARAQFGGSACVTRNQVSRLREIATKVVPR